MNETQKLVSDLETLLKYGNYSPELKELLGKCHTAIINLLGENNYFKRLLHKILMSSGK